MAIPFTPPAKRYIGDSVYIEFDGFNIILTTNNGYPDDPRNRIAMEPAVLESFRRWVKELEGAIAAYRKAEREEAKLTDAGPTEETLEP